jgi:hypothetical protein
LYVLLGVSRSLLTKEQSLEEPPPYNPNDRRHSNVESLPEYPDDQKAVVLPQKPFHKRKGIWICFGSFIILAAVVGGILGGLLHRKSSPSRYTSSTPTGTGTFYTTPDFIALAAVECDQVTFVIYEKYDNSLYLRGELKSGTFNGTSSSVIPEQRLFMLQSNSLATGTNITAICEQTSNTGVVSFHNYPSNFYH